jgi:mannose-6-phosphate isomerase-like protein (cupin superfamily)
MVRTLPLAGCVIAAVAVGAAASVPAQTAHGIVAANAVKWGPAPPSLPPGSQVALLVGDPAKSGLFVLRARLPDGYTVPLHWHSQAEYLTVISGRLDVGMGDTSDKTTSHAMGPGDFVAMPAKMRHRVRAQGETVIQVTSMGPFDIHYLDPKDNPQGTTGAR